MCIYTCGCIHTYIHVCTYAHTYILYNTSDLTATTLACEIKILSLNFKYHIYIHIYYCINHLPRLRRWWPAWSSRCSNRERIAESTGPGQGDTPSQRRSPQDTQHTAARCGECARSSPQQVGLTHRLGCRTRGRSPPARSYMDGQAWYAMLCMYVCMRPHDAEVVPTAVVSCLLNEVAIHR